MRQDVDEPGSAYAYSKRGVLRLVRKQAKAFGERGGRVLSLSPGVIDTPGNRAGMPNADRTNWLAPEALADALYFMASTRARGVVHELVVTPR